MNPDFYFKPRALWNPITHLQGMIKDREREMQKLMKEISELTVELQERLDKR